MTDRKPRRLIILSIICALSAGVVLTPPPASADAIDDAIRGSDFSGPWKDFLTEREPLLVLYTQKDGKGTPHAVRGTGYCPYDRLGSYRIVRGLWNFQNSRGVWRFGGKTSGSPTTMQGPGGIVNVKDGAGFCGRIVYFEKESWNEAYRQLVRHSVKATLSVICRDAKTIPACKGAD